MNTLTARSYAGETDLEAIAHFLNDCEWVDQKGDFYSANSLRLEFTEPGFDPLQDLRIWEDGEGRMVAFSQIYIPPEMLDSADAYLWFRIHPRERGSFPETDLIAWGERRLRQLARQKNLPARLYTGSREDQHDRLNLLEAHGFIYERAFWDLQRSLIPPIPQPELPEGFTIRLAREFPLQTSVDLYNQSFIDHWNFHAATVEEHQHWLADPNYRPELDLLAIAPDGTPAAFCSCGIDPEFNSLNDTNEGWIHRLGTRRGFRRQGLGRAMLLVGLNALWEVGVDLAKISVDSQNPNRAYALYQSVGFRKLHSRWVYVKDLPCG